MSTPANADGECLLQQAEQALSSGRYVEAWQKLDQARRNSNVVGTSARDIESRLALAWPVQEQLGRVRIGGWPRGKRGALSVSFDDGYPSQLSCGAAALTELGLCGSFYLTFRKTRVRDQAQAWSAAAAAGHEIGGHTAWHPPDLASLPARRIEQELSECDAFISSRITGSPVRTFAYPFFRAGDSQGALRSIVRQKYLAARAGCGTAAHNPPTPSDLHLLNSLAVGTATTAGELRDAIEQAADSHGWLILTLHAVVECDGFQPVSEGTWQDLLSMLRECGTDVWIASIAEVSEFVLARRSAQASWQFEAPNLLRVCVTAESGWGNLRLTVQIDVPPTWTLIEIEGRKEVVRAREGRLMLDVTPNGVPLLLRAVA